MDSIETYNSKLVNLISQFNNIKNSRHVTLGNNPTSHFVRKRKRVNSISLSQFNKIIKIDEEKKCVEVESACSYGDLVSATLLKNLIPAVVPELKGITVGGAISGLGIESSSFKFGLVHDPCSELDVLTSSGKILTCNNEQNSDLFKAIPNSLGSLGYITKLKLKLIPIKNYVEVKTLKFENAEAYFKALEDYSKNTSFDFLDGAIFSKTNFVIVLAKFIDKLPLKAKCFDRFDNIYYQYLRDYPNNTFYMSTYDYIWRWDTDGFWSSEYHPKLGRIFENRIFRNVYLKRFDNSNSLIPLKKTYDDLRSNLTKLGIIKTRYEDLFQDPVLTLEKCVGFLNWYQDKINVYPLWICPVNNSKNDGSYPLNQIKSEIIVDIGFYNRKKLDNNLPENYYTKLFEHKMIEMGITKGLYAKSFVSEENFWKQFDHESYKKIKNKYDPDSTFPDVYFKSIN